MPCTDGPMSETRVHEPVTNRTSERMKRTSPSTQHPAMATHSYGNTIPQSGSPTAFESGTEACGDKGLNSPKASRVVFHSTLSFAVTTDRIYAPSLVTLGRHHRRVSTSRRYWIKEISSCANHRQSRQVSTSLAHVIRMLTFPIHRPQAIDIITTYYLVRHDLSVCVIYANIHAPKRINPNTGPHLAPRHRACRATNQKRACIRRPALHDSCSSVLPSPAIECSLKTFYLTQRSSCMDLRTTSGILLGNSKAGSS